MDKAAAIATTSAMPRKEVIIGVLGGAFLLGIFIFTGVRMFTVNNGKSSTAQIEASTIANMSILTVLTLGLMLCYGFIALSGGLNPTQKYTLVFVLSAIAFVLSNVALLASTIYVQVN